MLLKFIKHLYFIPIFGRLLEEAFEGPDEAFLAFILNLVMTLAIVIFIFGIPALITIALGAVVLMFIVILEIAWG